MQLPEDGQNLPGGHSVQIAGGLVGQDQRRLRRQHPGDGHPLLLSARKLGRAMSSPILQPHPRQRFQRLLPADFAAFSPEYQRQLHIFQRRHGADQVEALEDKADLPVADIGGGSAAQPLHRGAFQQIFPCGGTIQTAQNVHQGGFSAARRAGNGQKVPLWHMQAHVLQRPEGLTVFFIGFCDVFQPNHTIPSFSGIVWAEKGLLTPLPRSLPCCRTDRSCAHRSWACRAASCGPPDDRWACPAGRNCARTRSSRWECRWRAG